MNLQAAQMVAVMLVEIIPKPALMAPCTIITPMAQVAPYNLMAL